MLHRQPRGRVRPRIAMDMQQENAIQN